MDLKKQLEEYQPCNEQEDKDKEKFPSLNYSEGNW